MFVFQRPQEHNLEVCITRKGRAIKQNPLLQKNSIFASSPRRNDFHFKWCRLWYHKLPCTQGGYSCISAHFNLYIDIGIDFCFICCVYAHNICFVARSVECNKMVYCSFVGIVQCITCLLTCVIYYESYNLLHSLAW